MRLARWWAEWALVRQLVAKRTYHGHQSSSGPSDKLNVPPLPGAGSKLASPDDLDMLVVDCKHQVQRWRGRASRLPSRLLRPSMSGQPNEQQAEYDQAVAGGFVAGGDSDAQVAPPMNPVSFGQVQTSK